MPAVIDTGGPRVLHRVERVERSYLTRSISRSVHQRSAASTRSESAAVEASGESDGLPIGQKSLPIGQDSLPIGQESPPIEFPADRGLRLRDRKRCDAVERRWIKRRERKCQEIPKADGDVDSSSASPSDRLPIDGQETGPSAFSGRRLRPRSCLDRTENEGRSSPIVTRLLGDDSRLNDVVDAISTSQRILNCANCEWRCFTADVLVTTKSEEETERSTRERRKPRETRKAARASYLQLALVLFLVAFGNPLRSNLATFSGGGGVVGRNAGVSAGLGLLGTFGTIVGAVRAAPVDLDAGVRSERSANLSHISGASRKIQMYIKNRHLQILRDGTVNGSTDDTSEYTIFQRTSVSRGQLRIQGVATCLYLCMDSCGLLYGSREYTEECVFNETLEQHNYNTYSSVRWSTPKKSLYLGLNRRGQPRRVQARGHNLGRLSAYARVLTQVAPAELVEALQARMLGAQHAVRHRHNANHHHRHHQQHHNNHRNKHQPQEQQQQQQQQPICPTLPPQEKDGRDKFRCRKRKKRKKWKRRCDEGEKPGSHCAIMENGRSSGGSKSPSPTGEFTGGPESKRSCEGEASEELCRKQALDAPAKKRKSRIDASKGTKQQQQQQQKKRKETRGRKTEDTINGDVSPSGVNRRKKPSRQRSSSSGAKNGITGRPTRTTNVTTAVTPPSVWTTSATAPPTEVSSRWPLRSKSTLPASRNYVTSLTAKNEEGANLKGGKSLARDENGAANLDESTTALSTLVDDPRSSSIEDRSMISSLASDWSGETSDEIKYDESITLQEDNETTPNYGDYGTLVPTMDTIPPRTTVDYTRAFGARSGISSLDQPEFDARREQSRKFHPPNGQSYEGLAM